MRRSINHLHLRVAFTSDPIKNDSGALAALSKRLLSFVDSFADLFKTRTDDGAPYARIYLDGLLTEAPRKNMERMNEHLDAGQYENVQQFISNSPWDESALYDRVAARASARIGARPETCLIIDESAISKKGTASVGVARQYNGRLGKQDNCQVGVFSALNSGVHTALIGARLYLPDEWAGDEQRCLRAGVPQEQIQARSKLDLALELIDQAVGQQARFSCVVIDSFYGRDSKLLASIDARGLVYCAEVPCNTNVFTRRPASATRPTQIKQHTRTVGDLASEMAADKKRPATQIALREGENGMLMARLWRQRVWVWPAGAVQAKEQWLLVRRMSDGELKTSMSNAAATTTLKRLAQWQAGRFHIERAFQDAKSHLGMAQYQSRGWRAWHHHMALVIMAHLFLTEERMMQGSQEFTRLSARDVVEMLDYCLTKPRSAAQVLARVRRRHEQRERNARSAQKRRREQLGLPKLRKSKPLNIPK